MKVQKRQIDQGMHFTYAVLAQMWQSVRMCPIVKYVPLSSACGAVLSCFYTPNDREGRAGIAILNVISPMRTLLQSTQGNLRNILFLFKVPIQRSNFGVIMVKGNETSGFFLVILISNVINNYENGILFLIYHLQNNIICNCLLRKRNCKYQYSEKSIQIVSYCVTK